MVTSRQDFAKGVDAFVQRVESIAGSLSPGDWQKTVYEGGWNVKQVYCHLASMAGGASFIINMAASMPPSGGGGQGGFDIDAFNAREVAARQDKPSEEIIAELKSGCARSKEAVEAASDELLGRQMTMPWGVSGTLAEILATSVAGHQAAHLDDVERAIRGG
jgi:hypothetical protein